MKFGKSLQRTCFQFALGLAMFMLVTGAHSAEDNVGTPAASVDVGGRTYLRYCALCHGIGGTGLGPLSDALQKAPPDLTLLAQRNGGVFPVDRVKQIIENGGMASHGMMAMLAWGKVFNEELGREGRSELINSLAAYLEQLQEH
jgi:mono/diheme cytochrome c family protein